MTGDVQRVRTVDGRTIECDFVVVGVGATPNTELAAGTGIAVENGIVTDEFLQTAVEGVFAAGDVANARHPLFGQLRVEHWANALHQGPTAARNMLGGVDPGDRVLDHPVAYDRIPYFYSDQYDVGMEYCGHATDWDEVVFRGDVKGREFIAFWLKDQRILAGMNVNVWDVTDQIQSLIRSRLRVDRDRLADADTPLTELAPDLPPRRAPPPASAAATVEAKTAFRRRPQAACRFTVAVAPQPSGGGGRGCRERAAQIRSPDSRTSRGGLRSRALVRSRFQASARQGRFRRTGQTPRRRPLRGHRACISAENGMSARPASVAPDDAEP